MKDRLPARDAALPSRVLFAWLLLLLVPPGAAGAVEPEQIEAAVTRKDISRLEVLRVALRPQVETDAPGADYDLAYVNWRLAQAMDPAARKERKKLLKEAQSLLDQVLEEDPRDAEAMALRGSAIGDRIDGGFSGMSLGPKASRAHQRAHDLAPDNPRVALLRGVGFFFTPKTFGGGLNNAETELRRAVALFADEPATTEWPNWGRVDALAWLGQVLAKQGDLDGARARFEEALRLEPDHVWVRDELLPGLQSLEE